MRGGEKRSGGWCIVLLLLVLALPGPRARADAGSGRADVLCAKAETAERDASQAERKSEERQRFLKGKGGTNSRNDTVSTVPTGGDSAAVRQSVRAKLSEVRALLPQLRQGAAAADRDRGIVPGLSQYFTRMESNLGRMLQAADACLNAPQYCSVPPISCPPMPAMPSFSNSGSAAFIRQVQQSYAQSANQLRQACQNLNAGIMGEVERLKRESRPAGPTLTLPGIAPPQPFADTDLYLRRAENLRREASLSRQEADRISGVRGYCGARSHARVDAKKSHAVLESLKAAERRRKPEADFPLDAKVIDLKMEWEKKWDMEMALNAPKGPLPKLTGGEEKSAPAQSADSAPVDSKVLQEQTEFENRNADWMKKQNLLIEERLKEPNEYASAIYQSLKTNAPPLPYKKFDQLESGDVLLIAPEGMGWAINKTDKALSDDKGSNASHTIIYLKEKNGVKFFLDSQPFEGPRIVPEAYVLNKYGNRETEVAKLAQPLNKDEADALYAAAKEMRAKNLDKTETGHWYDKTNYGLWKEDKVCSEADWALIKAVGRDVPASADAMKRALGIDFSPADFYGNEQYFLVSPFVMKK